MNKFLLKINENDRDCVKYLDTETTGAFACGHYFVGLLINGCCCGGYPAWYGSGLEEIKEQKLKNITTILTEEELKRLFEFDEKIYKLGYRIVQGDKRYQKGLEYRAKIQDIIDKLNGEDNEKLFKNVQEEEREVLKEEYDLTDEDIDYIFDNYSLEYRDRKIVSCIWNNIDKCAYDTAKSMGYVKRGNERYFNYETFGEDLLNSENYLKLEDGRVVMLSY